jgi:polyhydroxyalkanoate synthesis regulator phasin
MPTPLFTSETGRELALRRHAALTPEQRKANMEAPNKGRGRIKDVADKVDILGAVSVEVLNELRALRTEVADLRQRVAA